MKLTAKAKELERLSKEVEERNENATKQDSLPTVRDDKFKITEAEQSLLREYVYNIEETKKLEESFLGEGWTSGYSGIWRMVWIIFLMAAIILR